MRLNRYFSFAFAFSVRSLLLAVVAGSAIWAIPARAGLFEDEDARRAILDLRRQVQTLTQQSTQRTDDLDKQLADEVAQNTQLRRGLLDMQNQVDNSLMEVARLRGNVEQLQRELNELRRSQKEVKELGVGLDPKLQSLEQRLSRLEPVKAVVDGLEIMVDQDEKRDFDVAMASFRTGDYLRSQKQFSDFLSIHSRSAYTPSAQFWLANAQYASKDVREAIQNYRAMVARAPTHPRAPDAQLGLANAYVDMKDTKAARKALEDLVRIYPQSEAAQAATARLQTLK